MTGSFWRRLKSTAPCNNSIVGGRRHLDWQGPEWSKADLFLSGSRLLCAWTSSMILKLTGIYSFNRGKFEAENKENEIPLHMASEKLRFVFHLFLPSANTGGHSRMTRRIPNILGLPLGRWGEFRQRSFILILILILILIFWLPSWWYWPQISFANGQCFIKSIVYLLSPELRSLCN